MLSSFRKARVLSSASLARARQSTAPHTALRSPSLRALARVGVGLTLCTGASAAEIYYTPVVSLTSNYNSNIDLQPGPRVSAVGYYADAATTIGIATPTSETTLMPRLAYDYYPTQSALNRVEGFMNLNSRFTWQRDRFNVLGYFDHRTDLFAEQVPADYNPVTPGINNTNPGTGQQTTTLLRDVVRNYLILDPTYAHYLTPLSSVGFAGDYQRMSYSPPDTSTHVDFNYYKGRLFYQHTFTQRMDGSIGVFGSRYQASNIDSHSTSGGVDADVGYHWTQTWRSSLNVSYQDTKLDETSPRTFHESQRPWAAAFNTTYTGVLDSYRVDIGRTIYPSSAGGLYRTDQARAQYDRNLTVRLHLLAAARYFRDRTVSGIVGDDTRDYATLTTKLQWMMTQRIFIAGSYTWIWQKYKVSPSGADTNIVSLSIGYQGLQRQR